MSGVIRLGDVAARAAVLTIACRACPRHGRVRTARLLGQHGADAGMPDVLRSIAGSCPRLAAMEIRDRCDVHCPTLAALFAGPWGAG
jgi:hypothetical protein